MKKNTSKERAKVITIMLLITLSIILGISINDYKVFFIPLIGICFFNIIIKNPINLIYFIAVTMPFKISLIENSTIGITVTDLLSLLWIIMWLLVFFKRITKKIILYQKYLLIFLVFCIISTLISSFNRYNISSFIEIFRITISILVAISIGTVLTERKKIIVFLEFWIIGAFIAALYNIYYLISIGVNILDFISIWGTSVQNFYGIKFAGSQLFEDPNNYASYLVISIFFNIALIKQKSMKKHLKDKFLKIILCIIIISLLYSLSRGAYISIILAFLLLIFLRMSNFKRGIFIMLVILLLPFVVIKVFFVFIDDVSAMSRLGLWKIALLMTMRNPILGVGLANYTTMFKQYDTGKLLISNPYTHNLFLKISSELGIIGLFVFCYITIKPIYTILFSKAIDVKHSILDKYIAVGVLSFMIQGMTVEYFSSRHFWISVGIMMVIWNQNYKIRKIKLKLK